MQPFKPHILPLQSLDWTKFLHLIGEANGQVARFDGILQSIPNPAVLLSPLTTQEAVLSSKIEGTQATLQEVLQFEAEGGDGKNTQDIEEILNYRKAMSFAMWELEKLPMSQRLLCESHKILLEGARWQNKTPGYFRTGQVHIGSSKNIEEASFVPPAPQDISSAFSNLEKYIHFDEKDRIVQLAVVHAQFEIIHPFWDGNGRIGRMILPLFLYDKKILSSPMFYLSGYFERHRSEYYERLRNISEKNDWENWILYFLTAVIEQAKENIAKAKEILGLYERRKKDITIATRSQFAIQAIDTLFSAPIFTSTQFVRLSGIKKPTAMVILGQLESSGIVRKIRQWSGRMPGVYEFSELLKITG